MLKILKKTWRDEDVYSAAVARFDHLYERFDKVVISFSGGKDSTVCLQLGLEAAERAGKLPLDVYFWDEEAISPETVDYMHRVSALETVRLKWLCAPIKHRNACSRTQPYWICWNPDEEDKWVRPMPEEAITDFEGFYYGATVPDVAHLVYGSEHGSIADVRGLRADESLRRFRAVSMRIEDNWIGVARDGYSYPVSPIYDWTTIDVWTAPRKFGWDYNRSYDTMAFAGIPPNAQRVCPPYGEEPLGRLYTYAECWPELWDKMVNRVPGAATAARYSNTELYGYGKVTLPPGLTWREWAFQMIELYPEDVRPLVARSVNAAINWHREKTDRPLDDVKPDPLTGMSWKYLANIANRGDLKRRRAGAAQSEGVKAREKLGLRIEDAADETGTRY